MKATMIRMVLGLGLVGASGWAADLWQTDFAAASKLAKESGKYVLVDFTGSDWCGWCIKLDKEVFGEKAFQNYAKENLVLVKLDFPRAKPQSAELKAQNEKLRDQYKVRGFPTIILLSPAGEQAAQTGYRRGGPEKYVEHLQELIAEHRKATAKTE